MWGWLAHVAQARFVVSLYKGKAVNSLLLLWGNMRHGRELAHRGRAGVHTQHADKKRIIDSLSSARTKPSSSIYSPSSKIDTAPRSYNTITIINWCIAVQCSTIYDGLSSRVMRCETMFLVSSTADFAELRFFFF